MSNNNKSDVSYHKSGAAKSRMNGAYGLGSRTPIRFGASLKYLMKARQTYYELISEKDTDNYLVYLYRRPLERDWNSFVLIQGARRRGRFNIEVALSKRKKYPFHWASSKPSYAVDGVRERLNYLIESEDKWWTYTSAEELENVMETVISETLGDGITLMMENYKDLIERELNLWMGYLRNIKETMSFREGFEMDPREIFYDTYRIDEIADYVEKNNRLGTFSKAIPDFMQEKLEDPAFMTVQCKLMAHIMDLPDIDFRASTSEVVIPYEDDLTVFITGRVPPEYYFKLPQEEKERHFMYSYIKVLSILESVEILQKGEVEDREKPKEEVQDTW